MSGEAEHLDFLLTSLGTMAAQQLGLMGPGSFPTKGLDEDLHCLITVICLMICVLSL